MKENVKASLWVNKISIDLNEFVEEFLGSTVVGAVSALKGTESIKTLELVCNKAKDGLSITVNGKSLELKPFPKQIITNTLIGLVSTLKGVDKIDNFKITAKVS